MNNRLKIVSKSNLEDIQTEWQKMQTGEIYNDFDQDLFNRRVEAKKLFRTYNRTEDDETDKRRDIMQNLFRAVGKNVWIEPDFRCEFGKNISIGDNVYINFGCVILDCVAVGNPCRVLREITDKDKVGYKPQEH